jgi:hypothetical protein
MSKPEREIVFYPAFDCIRNPCKFGSDTCKPGSGGSHGIHCVDLVFYLKSPELVVQFQAFTGWYLPETPNEDSHRIMRYPYATDLGYHSTRPRYDGQEAMECSLLEQGHCYYDGSSLNAKPILELLLREGSEAVWPRLEEYFNQLKGE